MEIVVVFRATGRYVEPCLLQIMSIFYTYSNFSRSLTSKNTVIVPNFPMHCGKDRNVLSDRCVFYMIKPNTVISGALQLFLLHCSIKFWAKLKRGTCSAGTAHDVTKVFKGSNGWTYAGKFTGIGLALGSADKLPSV